MKLKFPKQFGIVLKFSTIIIFIFYVAITSKIEKVNSLESVLDTDVTQNIISYETIEELNENLDFMERKVVQPGINGLSLEYNGIEIEIQKPQTQIIQIGKKVLDTFKGNITGYGPDCKGCSGTLGSGKDVRSGNIYYEDSEYGKLRIVAADSKYPYGSVFRISNSRALNEPILAIVMDRGGAIKNNKIDLLFESEANVPKNITQKNVTVDIIRLGW